MQFRADHSRTRVLRVVAVALACIAAGVLLRNVLIRVCILVVGAAVIALLTEPLCRAYERRLPRPAAAAGCIASVVLTAAAAAWLIMPAALRELTGLAQTLPRSVSTVSEWVRATSKWLESHLPGLNLRSMELGNLSASLSGFASGIVAAVGHLSEFLGSLSLMVVLAGFFLRDRDRLLLRLELVLPQSCRHTAVGMGSALCRELRMYLRGQLTIALAVSLLAAAGLALIRVRGALVLGPVVGLFNLIPYFGPYIGGLPAVLSALGDEWQKGLQAVLVLISVQQIDGLFISPRVLGNITGLSPALVLVGIFAGATAAGVPGMLLALPAMLVVRTIYRTFVQRLENRSENI